MSTIFVPEKKEELVNVDDVTVKKDPFSDNSVNPKSDVYAQAWNGQREYLLRILAHNLSEALLPEQSTAIVDLIREIHDKIPVKEYPKETVRQHSSDFGFGAFGTQSINLQQEVQNLENTISQQRQRIKDLENRLVTDYGISKKIVVKLN